MHPSSDPPSTPGLAWRWILVGVVLGAFLITTFVAAVWNEPPRPGVAILVGALTFVLTGIFAAYLSPGDTVLEGGVTGIGLSAAVAVVLTQVMGLSIPWFYLAGGAVAGSALALLGAWVGEVLQGTLDTEEEPDELQWAWIAVGMVLGFILNTYFVFVGRAVFGLSPLQVLASFALSFVVTGFFVGYFSPGVTLLEPAIAGIGLVVLDTAMTALGFGAPFPLIAIAIGMLGAFLLALAGGWLGEIVQARRAESREARVVERGHLGAGG